MYSETLSRGQVINMCTLSKDSFGIKSCGWKINLEIAARNSPVDRSFLGLNISSRIGLWANCRTIASNTRSNFISSVKECKPQVVRMGWNSFSTRTTGNSRRKTNAKKNDTLTLIAFLFHMGLLLNMLSKAVIQNEDHFHRHVGHLKWCTEQRRHSKQSFKARQVALRSTGKRALQGLTGMRLRLGQQFYQTSLKRRIIFPTLKWGRYWCRLRTYHSFPNNCALNSLMLWKNNIWMRSFVE
jgi:hypothetical protein